MWQCTNNLKQEIINVKLKKKYTEFKHGQQTKH